MRPILAGAFGALGTLACVCAYSCGGSYEPTRGTPATTLASRITEARVGSVRGHQLAWVNFQMSQAGLVTLSVEPILLMTLRAGQCPESCGDFITNSDSGTLTIATPAGVNSVLIGNPFDDDRSFTLSIAHPR